MYRFRVYADTSVFGGACDSEFRAASHTFFRLVNRGDYVVLISDETLRELADAPDSVREVYEGLSEKQLERVVITTEVLALARAYVDAGVVSERSSTDAMHVAAATAAAADLILSWNFRHIVNFNRIRGYNEVNIARGYRHMTILSPLEIGDDDEKEDL